MNSSLFLVPQPRKPYGKPGISRDHVLRLGKLSAAVVIAGTLLATTQVGADAAPASHHGKAAHHAHRGHGHKAAKAKAAGRGVTASDATGDVTTSHSLLSALNADGRRSVTSSGDDASEADLTGATVTRNGDDLEITYDTVQDFSGQQALSVPGLVDLGATEAYHLAIHAAGGATVYSATGTMSGSGSFSSDEASSDADGSVTFTVPVGALPRSGELHIHASTDLSLDGTLAGGLMSASVSGHLTDSLDFGYQLGS
jgi:hypothetical protein